jgi:formate dehydrogenase iron-sulfur subunit
MDKCTFCAGGPEETGSSDEIRKYGSNRLAEGKLPLCAEMCATKALIAGDGDMVSDIYRKRVINRSASALGTASLRQAASFAPTPDMSGKATSSE